MNEQKEYYGTNISLEVDIINKFHLNIYYKPDIIYIKRKDNIFFEEADIFRKGERIVIQGWVRPVNFVSYSPKKVEELNFTPREDEIFEHYPTLKDWLLKRKYKMVKGWVIENKLVFRRIETTQWNLFSNEKFDEQ